MIKNFIIIASVTVNFSFLLYFYRNLNDNLSTYSTLELSPTSTVSTTLPPENIAVQTPSAMVLNPTIEPAIAAALAEARESENYANLAELLRTQSYPEGLVRQIVLATISHDQLLSTQKLEPAPYWLEAETDQSNSDLKLDELANKRRSLISIFGADIIEDPLFETLFKPLNDSLSFLDSDKQIAVDETRKRASMSALQLSRGGFITEMRDDRFREAEELEASLRAILTVDEFTEYELRESRLAARMKETMAAFDYSELEFRDIFTIRRNNEGSEFTKLKDRQSFRERRTASNEEIKNYLGDQRYKEFERSQDPAYRSLLTIGERYGNTTNEITEVYEISRATETEVSEIMSDKSLTRGQRSEMIEETRRRAMEEITKIAGEQSAKSIESNAARFRRFRGSH